MAGFGGEQNKQKKMNKISQAKSTILEHVKTKAIHKFASSHVDLMADLNSMNEKEEMEKVEKIFPIYLRKILDATSFEQIYEIFEDYWGWECEQWNEFLMEVLD